MNGIRVRRRRRNHAGLIVGLAFALVVVFVGSGVAVLAMAWPEKQRVAAPRNGPVRDFTKAPVAQILPLPSQPKTERAPMPSLREQAPAPKALPKGPVAPPPPQAPIEIPDSRLDEIIAMIRPHAPQDHYDVVLTALEKLYQEHQRELLKGKMEMYRGHMTYMESPNQVRVMMAYHQLEEITGAKSLSKHYMKNCIILWCRTTDRVLPNGELWDDVSWKDSRCGPSRDHAFGDKWRQVEEEIRQRILKAVKG
jgi:hypothetical protein